jgi:hypothetical protein
VLIVSKVLDKAIVRCISAINKILQTNIYDLLPNLMKDADVAGLEIIERWGQPSSQGGLLWASYKATCRVGFPNRRTPCYRSLTYKGHTA